MSEITPPPLSEVIWEAKSLFEFPKFLLNAQSLLQWKNQLLSPQVLVIPGYGADDNSTYFLRQFLTFTGAEAWGWGLGLNKGNVAELVPQLVEKVTAMYEKTHEKVHLVGWSLGGVLSREIAREIPDKVEQVITMGSPIIGGPKYTIFAGNYRSRGMDVDEIAEIANQRNETPINVPLSILFSKQDKVVAWEACIDHKNAHAKHIEIQAPHFGMGFSPEVFEVVVSVLAGIQDEDLIFD